LRLLMPSAGRSRGPIAVFVDSGGDAGRHQLQAATQLVVLNRERWQDLEDFVTRTRSFNHQAAIEGFARRSAGEGRVLERQTLDEATSTNFGVELIGEGFQRRVHHGGSSIDVLVEGVVAPITFEGRSSGDECE